MKNIFKLTFLALCAMFISVNAHAAANENEAAPASLPTVQIMCAYTSSTTFNILAQNGMIGSGTSITVTFEYGMNEDGLKEWAQVTLTPAQTWVQVTCPEGVTVAPGQWNPNCVKILSLSTTSDRYYNYVIYNS